jgi:hypothetical protein
VDVDTPLYKGSLQCCVLDDPVADLIVGTWSSGSQGVISQTAVAYVGLFLGEQVPIETESAQPHVSEFSCRSDSVSVPVFVDGSSKEIFQDSSDAVAEQSSTTPSGVGCVSTRSQVKADKKPITPLDAVALDHLAVDRDCLIQLQRDDESLRPLIQLAQLGTGKSGKAPFFVIREGVLMRRYLRSGWDEIFQIVVPQSLRHTVLQAGHDILFAGHGGVRRTVSRIYSNFFWPGVYKDVKAFCKSCDICQKTVPKGKVPHVPLEKVERITVPFKRVATDLVGPISPPSEAVHRYILTIVDIASHYSEAVPLRNSDIISVAEELMTVFSRIWSRLMPVLWA